MTNAHSSKTFGLITGLGMGAGIYYYRSLVRELVSRGYVPDLLLAHADVRTVLRMANAREVQALAEYLSELLRTLARGGAELAAIPAFAPQVCARELQAFTPLPLIDLLDAIAHEVRKRELRRVALFGARVTIETKLFGRLHDIAEVVTPTPQEIDLVQERYARVVEQERATPEDYEVLRGLAHRLIGREGLDAILLAGTDLAFVFNPENTDFPSVDGARIHIDAIVRAIAPER